MTRLLLLELQDAPAVRENSAERLTALVEGLSERRLSGSITRERARSRPRGAIAAELGSG